MQFLHQDTYWNPSNMIYGNNQHLASQVKMPDILAIRQSTNLYSYAANNPLKYVDPSGYFIQAMLVGGAVGALFNLGMQMYNNMVRNKMSLVDSLHNIKWGNVIGVFVGGALAAIPGANVIAAVAAGAAGNVANYVISAYSNGEEITAKELTWKIVEGAVFNALGYGVAQGVKNLKVADFNKLDRTTRKNILTLALGGLKGSERNVALKWARENPDKLADLLFSQNAQASLSEVVSNVSNIIRQVIYSAATQARIENQPINTPTNAPTNTLDRSPNFYEQWDGNLVQLY